MGMDMELQELYQLIGLQTEIIRKLESIREETDLRPIRSEMERLMKIKTAKQAYQDLKAFFQEDTDNWKMLYCQLECARRTFEQYQQKRIAKAVYIDTMKCFPRFLEECQRKNGRMYFD